MNDNPTALAGLVALDVDRVHPSPNNPRDRLTDIEGLAASIREAGLIQPLIVQRRTSGGGSRLWPGTVVTPRSAGSAGPRCPRSCAATCCPTRSCSRW